MLELLMFKDRLNKQLQEKPSTAYWESHESWEILSWIFWAEYSQRVENVMEED